MGLQCCAQFHYFYVLINVRLASLVCLEVGWKQAISMLMFVLDVLLADVWIALISQLLSLFDFRI